MTGGNVKGSKHFLLLQPYLLSQLVVNNSYVVCVCVCVCVCVYRSVLAKAIHSLSRVGDELYVEPQDDGVSCSDAVT